MNEITEAPNDDALEISWSVHEEIASWRRVINGRREGVDVRSLLREAATVLWQTIEIDRTSQTHNVTRQAVVDAFAEMAEVAGVLPDEAQLILAENFRQRSATPANGHSSDEPPPVVSEADLGLVAGAPGDAIHHPRSLVFRRAADLEGLDVPRRRWLVHDRIPMRAVTNLSGDGASGKTTILLQLCAAVPHGADWLGAVIEETGPAMFVTAEEDADEVHRRLAAINAANGRGFAELAGLHFVCLPGEDATLATAGRDGILRPSALFGQIETEAKKIGPKLIGIEAAADVYGGDENNRGQVRQFVQLLRRLAIVADAAVVLVQHPSVSGLAEGQGRSGSTAWRNSARSQLYFAGPSSSRDDQQKGDVRELRVVKANYGPIGEAVQVRWQRGVYVPVGVHTSLERLAADAEVDALFMVLLERASAQGRTVGPHPGTNYAPAVFAKMPEANGVKAVAFGVAMERLFSSGRIKAKTDGPPSRTRTKLVPTNAPANAQI